MSIVAQAADALHAAHENGTVHRDVKPGNLIVKPNGTVILVDFGVARSAAVTSVTGLNAIVGTALYMAPEQVAKGNVTPATDIYALGAVAYHCIAGQPAVRRRQRPAGGAAPPGGRAGAAARRRAAGRPRADQPGDGQAAGRPVRQRRRVRRGGAGGQPGPLDWQALTGTSTGRAAEPGPADPGRAAPRGTCRSPATPAGAWLRGDPARSQTALLVA